ncbi:site-specific DNA-methyltransferase [Mycolicibacter sinensis]|uniref:site-specific DNA-methyltransferase n=1 Tax=Mycolicibacter sinensis (strain JDM601) TaxID=875328 RepID=UPI000ACB95C1|nr:site-specific DNA-methyltransferase [Mycolicibacter sinensis]
MTSEPCKVELHTADLAAANRAALEELFPGVLEDGVLDAGRLGALLDLDVAAVTDGRERFGLMWAGKNATVKSLFSPSTGSLIPDDESSINFDAAHNIFIEGDNLEVLKLLQKPYNDQIKLIYIDPPYNTGNDFIYADDYTDPLTTYLKDSGQLDGGGNHLSAKVETDGRKHSRWLSMMYPRLILARNLLAQDGIFLCSIDDTELANLTEILKEIYGENNHLATFVWVNEGHIEQQSRIKVNHEYIIAFARNEALVGKPSVIDLNMTEDSKLFNEQIENSITKNGPANPPSTVLLPVGFPASADEFSVPTRTDRYPHILDVITVKNGRLAQPARLYSGWSSRRLLDLFIANDFDAIEDSEGKNTKFVMTHTGAIYIQKTRATNQSHMLTILRNMGTTQTASSRLKRDLGIVFDFPKPETLIQYLISAFTQEDDIILDFFAGSGTTAHAAALQNAVDGGRRSVISVNIPEAVDPGSSAGSAGFRTVSEICLKRIKGVADAVQGANELGLRVLRLGQSNFRQAAKQQEGFLTLEESTLVEKIPNWNAVAFEVLLKEGVRADTPWGRTSAKNYEIVTAGDVSVVLSTQVDNQTVETAFELGSNVVIFLEDGFIEADAVKTNASGKAKDVGITMKTV